MILSYGDITVQDDWEVKEASGTIFTRIYFVVDGEAYYEDESGVKSLKKKHLYCMPNNKKYQMYQNNKKPLSCLFLHMTITPYMIENLIEIDLEGNSFCQSIRNILSETMNQFSPEHSVMLKSTIADALIEYLRLCGYLMSYATPVKDAIQLMVNNIHRNVSVKEMADTCGYHGDYFVRLFKKHMGITPHQYMISYKMQVAMKLLQSNISITQISEQLGFEELKLFSRAFKNYYGVSPSKLKMHTKI